MQVKIFTKEDGPEMREAKELGEKLESEDFEVYYLDEEETATHSQMELYDIYSFPSFVVAQEDGQIVEKWQGKIPLESDLKMFLLQ